MSRGSPRTSVNLADTARRLARQRSVWQGLVDFDPIIALLRPTARRPRPRGLAAHVAARPGRAWHDHGGSAGSFVVLQGVLTEEVAGYRRRPTSTTPAGSRAPACGSPPATSAPSARATCTA